MKIRHKEQHNIDKIGWLRAAVLGANDGIISTASLMLGIAAAVAPASVLIPWIAVAALLSLAFLGGLAARNGGAKVLPGVLRVSFWSALAMGVTAIVGTLFGTVT